MTDKEINEAVAKKLGYEKTRQMPIDPYSDAFEYWSDGKHVNKYELHYTDSIKEAWEVVEKMNKCGYVSIERGVLDPQWLCSINWAEGPKSDFVIIEFGDTAPMAICLAFLKLDEKA